MAYQNLDSATIGAFQRMLGVPITGQWDSTTDAAMRGHLQSRNLPYGYGTTGNMQEWEFLTATLRENEANPNPAFTDPAYLAFLRMSGVQEANIRNEIEARINQAQRETNRAAAGFEQQKQDQTRNIALDFEDRGLFGSGARVKQQQDAVAKVDYNRQMEEAARTDALTQANRRAEQDLAELAQRRVEEELGARSRVAEKRGKQTYQAGL